MGTVSRGRRREIALCATLVMVGGCCNEVTTYASETHDVVEQIVAGEQLIAVAWGEQSGPIPYTYDGMKTAAAVATLTPSGELRGVAAIPTGAVYRGVAGSTTSLWYGLDDPGLPIHDRDARCDGSRGSVAVSAALVVNETSTPLALTTELTTDVCATFDGSAYQVFWRAGNGVRHRTVFEDGVLGPVHDMTAFGVSPQLFTPTSDRAGAVYVLVVPPAAAVGAADFVVRINPDDGTALPVWTASDDWLSQDTFFFAGEVQVLGRSLDQVRQIESIDPGNGTSRSRALDSELQTSVSRFDPGATRLLGITHATELLIVDQNFTITDREPAAEMVTLWNDDLVQVESISLDENELEPARLEVVRSAPAADLDLWRVTATTDPEVLVTHDCIERRACGNNVAPGAELAVALAVAGLNGRRRARRRSGQH